MSWDVMNIKDFIKLYKTEIDYVIGRNGFKGRINDGERVLTIKNDFLLYSKAVACGVLKDQFLSEKLKLNYVKG